MLFLISHLDMSPAGSLVHKYSLQSPVAIAIQLAETWKLSLSVLSHNSHAILHQVLLFLHLKCLLNLSTSISITVFLLQVTNSLLPRLLQ